MKCKKFILKKMYDGLPKVSDFELVEEEVSENLEENEFLYGAMFVSVDPYMRAYARRGAYKEGDEIIGLQLSKVTKSNNIKYPVGTTLVVSSGWRSGGKSKGDDVWYLRNNIPKGIPLSAGMGMFGMPGLTAYFGLLDCCEPKSGETVFVSGASGAVGNVVGQIAKIKGCRVVGSCGSDEKVDFIKSLGFDDAFNYKTEKSLDDAIKRVAPNGIDCYFENVGGDLTQAIMKQMNKYSRIAVCGLISGYNSTSPLMGEDLFPIILSKEIKVRGFMVLSFKERFSEAFEEMKTWAEQGKLKNAEVITKGFERLPETFIGMLQGKNIGKAVVEV